LAFIEGLQFRLAARPDAAAIAALHADSWRRHYRGAYSDAFLDGDVAADRLAAWTDRLSEPDRPCCTILAEDGGRVVGFAHTILDHDPTWGALLDNLHVASEHQRGGVGSRLMALTARAVTEQPARTGLYLWVLEQNVASQAFYEACGGRRADKAPVSPPGGVPSRLNGSPAKLRYAWPDPSVLLEVA
jgi:ribosomal protein S18 acetylase RimI-like enzyme